MKQSQRAYETPSTDVLQIHGLENVCDNLSNSGNAPDYDKQTVDDWGWDDPE